MRRRRGIKGDFSKKIGILCLALLFGMGSLTIGYAAWTDTLTIDGTVNTGNWGSGGTPGFWKNWDSHNTYSQGEIEGWLVAIDSASDWFIPDTNEDIDEDGDNDIIDEMEAVFTPLKGGTAYQKFLRQYLATRLNVAAGRLNLETTYDVTSISGYEYLGLDNPASSATLTEIIAAIESKYNPTPPPPPPTDDEFLIMKNICDALNNELI